MFGSFSGSETQETIRCDKTVHRHIFRRQFTDIIEDTSSTDSVLGYWTSSNNIYLSACTLYVYLALCLSQTYVVLCLKHVLFMQKRPQVKRLSWSIQRKHVEVFFLTTQAVCLSVCPPVINLHCSLLNT